MTKSEQLKVLENKIDRVAILDRSILNSDIYWGSVWGRKRSNSLHAIALKLLNQYCDLKFSKGK